MVSENSSSLTRIVIWKICKKHTHIRIESLTWISHTLHTYYVYRICVESNRTNTGNDFKSSLSVVSFHFISCAHTIRTYQISICASKNDECKPHGEPKKKKKCAKREREQSFVECNADSIWIHMIGAGLYCAIISDIWTLNKLMGKSVWINEMNFVLVCHVNINNDGNASKHIMKSPWNHYSIHLKKITHYFPDADWIRRKKSVTFSDYTSICFCGNFTITSQIFQRQKKYLMSKMCYVYGHWRCKFSYITCNSYEAINCKNPFTFTSISHVDTEKANEKQKKMMKNLVASRAEHRKWNAKKRKVFRI